MYNYIFVTEYLDEKIVDELFRKRGNWKKLSSKNNKQKVDFLYMDGLQAYQYKNLWKMDKNLFNMIDMKRDKDDIRNKNELYKLMQKKYPKIYDKYFPSQVEININTINTTNYQHLFKQNKIWILKIVEGGSGKHIYLIPDYKTFVNQIKELQKLNDPVFKKYPTFVLSEYINNPLTFKNKKFHLRLFYMYSPANKKAYLHKFGFIYTSKKDYVKRNYQNKNIHDTHFGSTIADYYFPHEFIKIYSKETVLNIYKQLIVLFHHIKLITKASCYPESNKCFQIFGADIMITDDFRVKILEINNRIGIATYDNKLVTKYLMEGILETMVDPLFPPKNKQPKYNYFIEV